MHELSVCQALIRQVEAIAAEHRAVAVAEIRLAVGPLSGVEIPLLEHAFSIARVGTCAESAQLHIDTPPLVIRCTGCGQEAEVPANRLVCPACGDWRTQVMSGEEMTLMSLELETEDTAEGPDASVPDVRT